MARGNRLTARLGTVGGEEPKRSPRRRIIVYVLLIAGSLLLLAASTSAPVQDVRRGVNYALNPIQEVLAGGARSVSSIFAAFAEVDTLRKENRDLRAALDAALQQARQLEVLRVENAKLSEALGTRQSLDFTTEAAFVVARSPSQLERTVTLDRGMDAGIEVGDAVLAPGGALAGVVTAVYDGSSDVRLLSDPRSLIIGLDSASRATGEVKGNFSAPLRLVQVAATEQLAIGDSVTTAGTLVKGFKALLPRDLLIGSIVEVTDDPSEFSKSALVQPAADLDRLEAVLVITSYEAPHIVDPDATPGAAGADATAAPVASSAPEKTAKPRKNAKP
jgi:rod shape-determining protein MreC